MANTSVTYGALDQITGNTRFSAPDEPGTLTSRLDPTKAPVSQQQQSFQVNAPQETNTTTTTWWKITISTPSHSTLVEWATGMRMLAIIELFSTIVVLLALIMRVSGTPSSGFQAMLESAIINTGIIIAIMWVVSAMIAHTTSLKARTDEVTSVLQLAVQHTCVGIARVAATFVLSILVIILLARQPTSTMSGVYPAACAVLFASVLIHLLEVYIVVASIIMNRYVVPV